MRTSVVRRALMVSALITVLLLTSIAPTLAHRVRSVSARSICHYEENYYVWTPGEPWRVWGKVNPAHRDKRVVLQRTRFGHNWKRWRTTRTRAFGKYGFRGTAHRQGSDWWVNLRVVFPAQDGHRRVVSKPLLAKGD